MSTITVTQATPEHFVQFYGATPQRTVRAIAALEGERVLGIAGVYPSINCLAMFFDRHPELMTRGRRAIVRGIRMLMAMAATTRQNIPIIAEADPAIEGSEKLLEHMGFTHATGRTYLWQA